MKPLIRVVGGIDCTTFDDEKSLAEARKRARPILREWLRRIELAVMAGELSPIDFLIAKELCNYPSANEGRCYAGQERLGAAVGSCTRTARSSLSRLRGRGFLFCKRGGPGRTASWTFCVNDKPIFGGVAFLPTKTPSIEKQQFSAQDRQHLSALDRKDIAAKPSEPNPIERNRSPLTPQTDDPRPGRCGGAEITPSAAGERGKTASGLPKGASGDATIEGEIITGSMSFQEFWLAAGKRGTEGFARAEWRKLSAADKAAISDRLQRDGHLLVRNLWAGTWLRDRVWEEAPPPKPDTPFDCDLSARPIYQHVQPGSDLWRAERERLRAAGFSLMVKLMDDRAAAGEGWTVQCHQQES